MAHLYPDLVLGRETGVTSAQLVGQQLDLNEVFKLVSFLLVCRCGTKKSVAMPYPRAVVPNSVVFVRTVLEIIFVPGIAMPASRARIYETKLLCSFFLFLILDFSVCT
jgi:hypothetical protein